MTLLFSYFLLLLVIVLSISIDVLHIPSTSTRSALTQSRGGKTMPSSCPFLLTVYKHEVGSDTEQRGENHTIVLSISLDRKHEVGSDTEQRGENHAIVLSISLVLLHTAVPSTSTRSALTQIRGGNHVVNGCPRNAARSRNSSVYSTRSLCRRRLDHTDPQRQNVPCLFPADEGAGGVERGAADPERSLPECQTRRAGQGRGKEKGRLRGGASRPRTFLARVPDEKEQGRGGEEKGKGIR